MTPFNIFRNKILEPYTNKIENMDIPALPHLAKYSSINTANLVCQAILPSNKRNLPQPVRSSLYSTKKGAHAKLARGKLKTHHLSGR